MAITPNQIVSSLRGAGVAQGDPLVVHSALRSVGTVEGGAEALIEALIETIGPEGMLAMPAFNYTRPVPAPHFDPLTTPGATGALTELFRRRPGTLRSLHPAHSVCAFGKHAAEYLVGHERHGSFGIDSPLDRIAKAGGWILLVGVTQTANSIIHVGESHARVRKFWWNDGEPPQVRTKMPDGSMAELPLDCSSSCSAAFNAVEGPMRDQGLIRDLHVGNAISYLMRGSDAIATVVDMIRQRPDVLFCTRHDCRPCRLGRIAVLENV